jgi:hypothetical protein
VSDGEAVHESTTPTAAATAAPASTHVR